MSTDQEPRNLISRKHKSTEANICASELPSDVLLPIFVLLRDMHCEARTLARSLYYLERTPIWDWLIVSMVCRRWRVIALEYPNLWTEINVQDQTNYDRIRAFFERSGRTEINLDIYLQYEKTGLIPLLDDNMWRVRKLKCMAYLGNLKRIEPCLARLSRHAKSVELENLSAVSGEYERPIRWLTENLPEFDPDVQLASLTLRAFTLPWSNLLYHGLSELKISNNELWFPHIPEDSQFIDALKHCPNLQHLTLEDFSPNFRAARVSDLEKHKVCFPRLQSITLIRLTFHDCWRLLACLSIGTNVDLNVQAKDYNFDQSERIPKNILRGRKECSHVKISLDENSYTLQSGYILDSSNSSVFTYTRITIFLPKRTGYRNTIGAIGALLEDPFWHQAHGFTISIKMKWSVPPTNMDRELWGSLLDGLPKHVRRLKFSFTRRYYQAHDAGLPEALLDTDIDGQTRFPELELLTVCYNYFAIPSIAGRLELFFDQMEKRRRRVTRAYKLSILLQKCSSKGSTLDTIDVDFDFNPISS